MLDLIEKAVGSIIVKNKFFGYWLIQCIKKYDDNIPTACIALDKRSYIQTYRFNPTWYNSLTDKERIGVLTHETLHDCYLHVVRVGPGKEFPDLKIANIAFDLAINQEIIRTPGYDKTYLPEGCLLPSTFPKLNLKLNEIDSYYYNELVKADKERKDKGSSGDKTFDNIMENDLPDTIKHLWELADLSETEKELLKNMTTSKLQSVSQSVGDTPLGIKQLLDVILKPPFVSWKKLLQQFIGNCFSSDTERTRKRPNKRFDDSAGSRQLFSLNVLIGIDVSGSISDKDFLEFMSEINHVSKEASVDVCQWDVETTLPEPYKYSTEALRLKAGGTNASCFIELANRSKDYDFVIIFTDGFIEKKPLPLNKNGIWVITSDGSTDIQHNKKIIQLNYETN
jgi:predicted metal-dependent peptidase